jgi:hypothetical protein
MPLQRCDEDHQAALACICIEPRLPLPLSQPPLSGNSPIYALLVALRLRRFVPPQARSIAERSIGARSRISPHCSSGLPGRSRHGPYHRRLTQLAGQLLTEH